MHVERDQRRILAVLVMIALVGGLGVYLPARQARANLAARAAVAQEAIGVDIHQTSLRDLHDRVIELRLNRHDTQAYIPPTDELADVLRGLTQSLEAFGATVHEVVVEDVRHHRDYSTIPLRLRFDAPFPAAYGVLRQVESMDRLIRVERLRLESDASNPAAPVHAVLEISTFFTPGPKEMGGS